MYLLIDAGNTRLKFACHDGKAWVHQDAIPHGAPLSIPPHFQTRHIVLANVAGPVVEAQLTAQLAPLVQAGASLHSLRPSAQFGELHNDYLQATQLGPDRWSAAIGAWSIVRSACIVVSAGTATTIDLISADAHFRGGYILPGIQMMRQALAKGTARLPAIDANASSADIPRDTAAAIAGGCLHAQIGAIQSIAEQAPAEATIILCGGAAPELLTALCKTSRPLEHIPHLVLEGLLCVARSRDNVIQ